MSVHNTEIANAFEKLAVLLEIEGANPFRVRAYRIASRTPEALSELMKIKGLGRKRVKVLYEELAIESLDKLSRAADSGEIQQLSGFGQKTQESIKQRIEQYSREARRSKLIDAEDIAKTLV